MGKIVDCPKCKNKVTLTPPAGFRDPRENTTSPEVGLADQFDDLDDVLNQSVKTPVQNQTQTRESSKPDANPGAKGASKGDAKGENEQGLKSPNKPGPKTKAKSNSRSKKRKRKRGKKKRKSSGLRVSAPDLAQSQGQPELQPPASNGSTSSEGQIPQKRLVGNGKRRGGGRVEETESMASAPLLPDGTWDSPELKQRKRMLQFGALGIVVTLLISLTIFWLASSSAPNEDSQTAGLDENSRDVGAPSDVLGSPSANAADRGPEEARDVPSDASEDVSNDIDPITDEPITDDPKSSSVAQKNAVDDSGQGLKQSTDQRPAHWEAPSDGIDFPDEAPSTRTAADFAAPEIPDSQPNPGVNSPSTSKPTETNKENQTNRDAQPDVPDPVEPAPEPQPRAPTVSTDSEKPKPKSEPTLGSGKTPSTVPAATKPRNPFTLLEENPNSDTTGPNSFIEKPEKKSPLVPEKQPFSEFAEALRESGAVLSEIKDEALLQRETALIGLPKYYLKPSETEPLKVSRKLGVTVGGVQFESTPVLDVIRELESLSGIPVTFDWDASKIRGIDFSKNISLNATDVDFESLFATVAEKMELEVVADAHNVVFSAPSKSSALAEPEMATGSWPFAPALSDDSVAELKRFIVSTLDVKEPDRSLGVSSNEISLTASTESLIKLDRLLGGMMEAASPETAQLSLSDQEAQPKVLLVEALFDRPLALGPENQFLRPWRISRLLRVIREQTGLNVFMDWNNLRELGWNPNTQIPGSFDEPTVRDALQELARALKCSWVVIDDSTVLMTTYESSRSKTDIEVYALKPLLKKNLSSGDLKRVLEDTLSRELQLPGVTVVYFRECECLIASAPQSVHRQLYSILLRLWEDLK